MTITSNHKTTIDSALGDKLQLAQSLSASDKREEAASVYRSLLLRPDVVTSPDMHAEILANLGALLLHEGDDPLILAEAIQTLVESRNRRVDKKARSAIMADANLGLAYVCRFKASNDRSDAFIANILLDGAEAVLESAPDPATLEWTQSVRALLVEAINRPSPSRLG